MITALIVSAGEPQLERCLESVHNQTTPFSNIVHVDNVIPEAMATNSGVDQVKDKWFMKVDGDFFLYPNAVETVLDNMVEDENIVSYGFPLFDEFIKQPIYGAGVTQTEIMKKYRLPNMLSNDLWHGRKLRKMGFGRKKCSVIVGTHFENPSKFQVFKRFFIAGIKYDKKYYWRVLYWLHVKTKDPLLLMAMRAIEFGMIKKHYPFSHNLDYDKEMFGEFNEHCCTNRKLWEF